MKNINKSTKKSQTTDDSNKFRWYLTIKDRENPDNNIEVSFIDKENKLSLSVIAFHAFKRALYEFVMKNANEEGLEFLNKQFNTKKHEK